MGVKNPKNNLTFPPRRRKHAKRYFTLYRLFNNWNLPFRVSKGVVCLSRNYEILKDKFRVYWTYLDSLCSPDTETVARRGEKFLKSIKKILINYKNQFLELIFCLKSWIPASARMTFYNLKHRNFNITES